MHAEEAVLFLVVTVLSFALVATIVAPLIRKKRVGPAGPAPGPFDALAALGPGEIPRCATCRRGLLPGFRFCPFDGTPLGPTAHQPGPQVPVRTSEPGGIPRKICPRCARAYRQDTAVCAHDGIPLVPVN